MTITGVLAGTSIPYLMQQKEQAMQATCKSNQVILAKQVQICQLLCGIPKPTVEDLLKLGLLVEEPICPFERRNTYVIDYDEHGFMGVECTSEKDHGEKGKCYGWHLRQITPANLGVD